MLALILVPVCLVCFVCQGFFSKLFSNAYTGPSSAATAVFATVYGLVIGGVTAVYAGFRFRWDNMTMLFATLNGIVLFAYNVSTVYSSRTGPFALQSLMRSFGGIIPPLIMALVFWNDHLSVLSIIGIVLMLAAFILYNLKGLDLVNAKKSYYLWISLLFLSNGCYNIINDAQQRLSANTLRNEMIMGTFLISALISFVWLLLIYRRKAFDMFRMPARAAAYMFGSCIPAAAAANIQLATLKYVPAAILFPILSGGLLILNTVLSVAALHEKMEKIQYIGIAIAVVSLVLLKL